ncbi:hypothetical protein DFH09DRAFT_1423966, partial [Mycena vulgaris]
MQLANPAGRASASTRRGRASSPSISAPAHGPRRWIQARALPPRCSGRADASASDAARCTATSRASRPLLTPPPGPGPTRAHPTLLSRRTQSQSDSPPPRTRARPRALPPPAPPFRCSSSLPSPPLPRSSSPFLVSPRHSSPRPRPNIATARGPRLQPWDAGDAGREMWGAGHASAGRGVEPCQGTLGVGFKRGGGAECRGCRAPGDVSGGGAGEQARRASVRRGRLRGRRGGAGCEMRGGGGSGMRVQ